MNFLLKKTLLNGLQEDHGLLKQFLGTYIEPYLRNSLSLHVEIEMT